MIAIWRSFGPLEVLRGVDFDLRPGEVHALLGENGAGKSTLARILAGSLAQHSGAVRLDGVDVSDQADRTGRIAMVHQHFMLAPSLTVAENIALPTARGRLPRKELGRIADEVEALGERLGMAIRGSARVDTLSVGEQQRVEIIRALYAGAKYLILDEPTANLAPVEVSALLDHMRGLASAEGIGLAIITHHLDEVIAVADRVTILRGGDAVATLAASDTTQAELARLMVGRAVETGVRLRATAEPGEVALRLAGVSTPAQGSGPALDGVDLEVRAGEIVGIAGVEGNGQAELEAVLAGLRPAKGTLEIAGADMTGTVPAARLAAGLSVIASDRYRDALVRELGVDANLAMTTYRDPSMGTRFGLSWKAIRDHARDLIEQLAIAAPTTGTPVGALSGGHAQRVVLGRALSSAPKVLVAAQPTRGLDVGATEFVHGQLDALRRDGAGVLLISSDLEELLALADRCLVIYRGRIVAAIDGPELPRERIGEAMGGLVGADA
ncbi:MAG: sugar-transporting ATPase [Nocardioides sp.]|nr:sugar-transporting ATPase [Nocardioides sp.]